MIAASATISVSAAETPVSIIGSACPVIPASRLVTVATTQTLVSGQSVVLAVAVDSADAPDLVITGPSGVIWSALGGHKSEASDRSVMLLRGRATQNIAAASNIQLNFGLVDGGKSVCVRGMRYASFIEGGFAIASDGQAQGLAATTPSVQGKSSVTGSMGIAAFIFSANTGALTPSAGAVSDGGACNAALDLCLRVAHQGDVSGAVALALTPATPSDWQATFALLATPGLFKDSFE